jgi:hypothetical protein
LDFPKRASPRKTGGPKIDKTLPAHTRGYCKNFSAAGWTLWRVQNAQTSSRWRALARNDLTLATAGRLPAPTHTFAHTRPLGNGNERENRPKTAETARIGRRPKSAAPTRLESRRPRCNGRFGPKRDRAPKRDKRDSRGLKIEIGPVYAE